MEYENKVSIKGEVVRVNDFSYENQVEFAVEVKRRDVLDDGIRSTSKTIFMVRCSDCCGMVSKGSNVHVNGRLGIVWEDNAPKVLIFAESIVKL